MDHKSRESTLRVDSSDQIYIRIFEIHDPSVFFFGKGFKKGTSENDHYARAMHASFILSRQFILFRLCRFFWW